MAFLRKPNPSIWSWSFVYVRKEFLLSRRIKRTCAYVFRKTIITDTLSEFIYKYMYITLTSLLFYRRSRTNVSLRYSYEYENYYAQFFLTHNNYIYNINHRHRIYVVTSSLFSTFFFVYIVLVMIITFSFCFFLFFLTRKTYFGPYLSNAIRYHEIVFETVWCARDVGILTT